MLFRLKTQIQNWLVKSRSFLRQWLARPKEDLTIVLLTKGDRDVRKIRLNIHQLWWIKASSFGLSVFLAVTFLLFVFFVLNYPERNVLRTENRSLRAEMQQLKYHLDLFQVSMDRMNRFDQKLRALTHISQKIETNDETTWPTGSVDFGDFQVDLAKVEMSDETRNYLDRSDLFAIQKMYSWMRRLFARGSLQEQSLEELYEVLKDREIELAFTPSVIPVNGYITSPYGYRIDPFTSRRALHRGMDIAARQGAPIVSPAEGTVTFVGRYGSYGNAIMIFHGYGVSTLYAHLDAIKVNMGQKIKRGELIGTVGTSGRSTAPHLHYEVIVHGVSVDPRRYVLDRTF